MRRYILAAALSAVIFTAFAQEGSLLRFKYKKDDSYRILSTVQEDVKVNGRLNHHAEIVSRVTINVTDVDEKGNGSMKGSFMTSESSTSSVGQHFSWGEEFKSSYLQG